MKDLMMQDQYAVDATARYGSYSMKRNEREGRRDRYRWNVSFQTNTWSHPNHRRVAVLTCKYMVSRDPCLISCYILF